MNVAVVKTGPGVTCPTAVASKLRRGQPMPSGNQIVLQKGQQDVAAAVQDRADLEKIKKERLEAKRQRRLRTAQMGDNVAQGEDAAGDQQHDEDGFEAFAARLSPTAEKSGRRPAAEDHAQRVRGEPAGRRNGQQTEDRQELRLYRLAAQPPKGLRTTAITTGLTP